MNKIGLFFFSGADGRELMRLAKHAKSGMPEVDLGQVIIKAKEMNEKAKEIITIIRATPGGEGLSEDEIEKGAKRLYLERLGLGLGFAGASALFLYHGVENKNAITTLIGLFSCLSSFVVMRSMIYPYNTLSVIARLKISEQVLTEFGFNSQQ
ncbi:MAG: hypothetical protein QXY05_04255 [Candidatus Anstonellales archaeon]